MRATSPARIAGFLVLACVAGCSVYNKEERPPWRAQAEEACLAQGAVSDGPYTRAIREIDGPGICGLAHPFKVSALAGGSVTLNAPVVMGCPMIAALDTWIKDVVQPAARARFGEDVVRINSMGAYSCRGINNMSGAKLSEHAFGNAMDVGGFVVASGRELNVMHGFNGNDEQERAFLHETHGGACSTFTTVLGPGYNIFHYNHFHLDLAMHGSTSRGPRKYCKPVPEQGLPEAPKRDALPDPPAIEEELDIARAPIPEPSYGRGGPDLVATAPVAFPPRAERAMARDRAFPAVADGRAKTPASPRSPPLVTFSYVGGPPDPTRPEAEATAPPEEHIPLSADQDSTVAPSPSEAKSAAPKTLLEGARSDWDATSSIKR